MIDPSTLSHVGITITGLDVIALALLLHVWLLVAGLAAWNDAQTGVEWVDRRIHVNTRASTR